MPPHLLFFLLMLPLPMRPQECGAVCLSEKIHHSDKLETTCRGLGLRAVPTNLPAATGILDLAENQLSHVSTASLAHLQQLTQLDLSGNGLHTLDTKYRLPTLLQLNLANNSLEALPALSGLLNLTDLDLSFNSLRTLPEGAFAGLGNLERLNLAVNRLQGLPEGLLRPTPKLKTLDLAHNQLEALPGLLLESLRDLEDLMLQENRLRYLVNGFFSSNIILPYVFLHDNPWYCDCNISYLARWLRDNEGNVYRKDKGKLVRESLTPNVDSVQCAAGDLVPKGTPVYRFKAHCLVGGDTDYDLDYGDAYEDSAKDSTMITSRAELRSGTSWLWMSPVPSTPVIGSSSVENAGVRMITEVATVPAKVPLTMGSSVVPISPKSAGVLAATETTTESALSITRVTLVSAVTGSTMEPSGAPTTTEANVITINTTILAPDTTLTTVALQSTTVGSATLVPAAFPNTSEPTPSPTSQPLTTSSSITKPSPMAPSTPRSTIKNSTTVAPVTLLITSGPPSSSTSSQFIAAPPTTKPPTSPGTMEPSPNPTLSTSSPHPQPQTTSPQVSSPKVTPTPPTSAPPGTSEVIPFPTSSEFHFYEVMALERKRQGPGSPLLVSCCLFSLVLYLLGVALILGSLVALALTVARTHPPPLMSPPSTPHLLRSRPSSEGAPSPPTFRAGVLLPLGKWVTVPRAWFLQLLAPLPTFRSSLFLWFRGGVWVVPRPLGRRPSVLSVDRGSDLLGGVKIKYANHSL